MDHLLLETSTDGAVATVTLNRPSLRNAFNSTTVAELQQTFRRLAKDPRVRVVVLTGSGEAFCGGADLNWMRAGKDFTLDRNRTEAAAMASMFHALARLPKVTLARVNGSCYGGGVGLVAACDLAITVDTAHFAFSEVKLGLIPAVIAPHVLAKLGYGRTLELFLTGAPFNAPEALNYGLVTRVVEAEQLDGAVAEQLKQLRGSAPRACAEIKSLLRRLPWTSYQRVDDLTASLIARLRSEAEGQEGLTAFLEKRPPAWALPPAPEQEYGEARD